ncbi:hypothetical protein ACUXIR_000430 [Staphylococcus hominis]
MYKAALIKHQALMHSVLVVEFADDFEHVSKGLTT